MSRQCYLDPECRRDATWKIGHTEVCADHAVNAWVDHAAREQRDKAMQEPSPEQSSDGPTCPACGAQWWTSHSDDCMTCAYDIARQEKLRGPGPKPAAFPWDPYPEVV